MAQKAKIVFEESGITLEVGQEKFQLSETSIMEISELRRMKRPTFLLKKEDKYFRGSIPQGVSLIAEDVLGPHLCANPAQICKKINPQGGKGACKKVLTKAPKLEDFSYIKTGWETFGTEHDCLSVTECSCFKKFPTRKTF